MLKNQQTRKSGIGKDKRNYKVFIVLQSDRERKQVQSKKIWKRSLGVEIKCYQSNF